MISFLNEYATTIQSLGWTLLHSLWQALVLYLIVITLLRVIPQQRATVRYVISCASLVALLVASVLTYLVVSKGSESIVVAQTAESEIFKLASFASQKTTDSSMHWAVNFKHWLEPKMPLLFLIWMTGVTIFLLRIVMGWFYLSRLRRDAVLLQGDWQHRLSMLARAVGLKRKVLLAQSAAISVPMVIGYLKPMVLLPVSMFSGLTAEQIETILIHELAHIRQNDFLVNVFQIVLESIFFFNPFVWILSGFIRREREYCCDDEVLRTSNNAILYARALAGLEEIRLQQSALALTLAQNKGQLLNRIRRIMERSAKEYSMKQRVVPALLVVIGLACASWLTISTDRSKDDDVSINLSVVSGDTLKPVKQEGSVSRKTIITFDENGKAHEEVYEVYEGDDDMKDYVLNLPFDVTAPMSPPGFVVPPTVYATPDVPAFPSFPIAPMYPNGFIVDMDTLPNGVLHLGRADWKEFSEAFEERFREQFSDFYKAHEAEFNKMMKEMEENFKDVDSHMLRLEELAHVEELREHVREDMARSVEEAQQAREAMEYAVAADRMASIEAEAARDMQMASLDMQRDVLAAREQFEQKLLELLVKDGYIKKGDKVNTFKREKNGAMEVNGKNIKDADLGKYNELYRRYFDHGSHFYSVE